MEIAKRMAAAVGGLLGLVVIVSIVMQMVQTLSHDSVLALSQMASADVELEKLLPAKSGPADVMAASALGRTNRRAVETELAVKSSADQNALSIFAAVPGLQNGIEIELQEKTLSFGDGEKLGPARAFQIHDAKKARGRSNVGYTWVSRKNATADGALEVRSVTLSGIAKQNRCRLSVKIQKMSNGAVIRDDVSDVEYACGI